MKLKYIQKPGNRIRLSYKLIIVISPTTQTDESNELLSIILSFIIKHYLCQLLECFYFHVEVTVFYIFF